MNAVEIALSASVLELFLDRARIEQDGRLGMKGTRTLNRPVSKTRVQTVCHLIEDIGLNLLSPVIIQVDLNGP